MHETHRILLIEPLIPPCNGARSEAYSDAPRESCSITEQAREKELSLPRSFSAAPTGMPFKIHGYMYTPPLHNITSKTH
jgi:hypothetical protein